MHLFVIKNKSPINTSTTVLPHHDGLGAEEGEEEGGAGG
jgi:hypothetical protein